MAPPQPFATPQDLRPIDQPLSQAPHSSRFTLLRPLPHPRALRPFPTPATHLLNLVLQPRGPCPTHLPPTQPTTLSPAPFPYTLILRPSHKSPGSACHLLQLSQSPRPAYLILYPPITPYSPLFTLSPYPRGPCPAYHPLVPPTTSFTQGPCRACCLPPRPRG